MAAVSASSETLAAPEPRREQHQDGQKLEAAQQHARRHQPFRGIGQAGEIAARADGIAEAGPDIGDRRRGAGDRCQKVKVERRQREGESQKDRCSVPPEALGASSSVYASTRNAITARSTPAEGSIT